MVFNTFCPLWHFSVLKTLPLEVSLPSVLIFVHGVMNRVPSPQVKGLMEGGVQSFGQKVQMLRIRWGGTLQGKLVRKQGSEAWKGEGRAERGCCRGRSPVPPDPRCDRGNPRAWTELQSHPPNPDAQDPASHTLLSVSHCLRAPQPGGLSQFPQQVYLRNSLLGTEVFKLLTFWPRLRHEGTFSCTSSSGVALRILVLSKWDLVPWRGVEPGRPALGVKSLNHWTTREGKKP